MEDARGPGRSPVPARPLRSARGPAAAGQGALSAAGDPAPAAVRHPGGSGRRRRDRPIDGKTSRRSHARSKGRGPLHLVSAWATRQRLVLGQEAVSGKSNEIVAIPLLLERLALEGALVTIDAIGAQNAIAATILRRGGDYLLALKANRPATLKDVETFFADPPPGTIETHATTDGEHGRIEVRRHAVCHDVTWMFSARHYPGEPTFPGLAMIGMVESTTQRGGKTSRERRYYLSSAKRGWSLRAEPAGRPSGRIRRTTTDSLIRLTAYPVDTGLGTGCGRAGRDGRWRWFSGRAHCRSSRR